MGCCTASPPSMNFRLPHHVPGRLALRALAYLCAGWGASACLAASSHEHGVGRMDLGLEGSRVMIHLELPLELLVGFERAPRTDAERALAAQALARLNQPLTLFGLADSAGCKPAPAKIEAPLLQSAGAAPAKPAAEGHADADVDYHFECSAPGALREVEIRLFDVFPRLARLEVQAVTPRGQMKAVLRRADAKTHRLALVR